MSFAMLPAELVLAMTERYLANRETMLKEWEYDSIARKVHDVEPGFIGKLFGVRRVTLEQARAEYQGSVEQSFHRAHGGHWAREAKGVRALAKQAIASGVPTVSLSASLAHAFEKAEGYTPA